MPELTDKKVEPPNFKIIFEHDDFFVIEKPHGVSCHGPDPVNLVKLLEVQGIAPYLCHRLDKETSGLLLIAKSDQVANTFSEIFSENRIQKYYVALGERKGKKKQGTIKGEMKKNRDGKWGINKSEKPDTFTQFFSFGTHAGSSTERVFIIKIIGGKTHQIRVALKANGSAIVGDQKYGKKNLAQQKRLCLHAAKLRFSYGERDFDFYSPAEFLPQTLEQNLLSSIQHPESLDWPKQ